MDKKLTIADLLAAKRKGAKIVAVSCYDYTTACILAGTDVQMALVGDSAAQLMLGFDSTLPATMDFMVAITAAVRRGAPNIYLVADMPFLSYQLGINEAVRNAGRFMAEAGAQMVKIEASAPYIDVIKAVSDAGMAVMAHIGIRPQSISRIGRFKAEATTAEMAMELISFADRLAEAGAGALLLEGTAAEVGAILAGRFDIPVIGCGSGAGCDGQILIAPDILGLTAGRKPKFAKNFADLSQQTAAAFSEYSKQVQSNHFPDDQHSYHMEPGELGKLKGMLDDRIR